MSKYIRRADATDAIFKVLSKYTARIGGETYREIAAEMIREIDNKPEYIIADSFMTRYTR